MVIGHDGFCWEGFWKRVLACVLAVTLLASGWSGQAFAAGEHSDASQEKHLDSEENGTSGDADRGGWVWIARCGRR